MIRKVMILSGIILISGCSGVPTTQIGAFGDSTSAITDKVGDVINVFNNASIERQYTSYAATYNDAFTAKHLTSQELAKIYLPINAQSKKKLAVYRANKSLGGYAKSLSSLAQANTRTEIDSASANIFGSMTSINTQYKILSGQSNDLFKNEDLALFSKLLGAVGTIIVEHKRQEALKEIVTKSDPNVAILCDEITNQLKQSGMVQSITASRNYIFTEELLNYKERLKKQTDLSWRKEQIKRLHTLQKHTRNSQLEFDQTLIAINAVKTTHSVLAKELSKDRFSSDSIVKAIGHLKELEKHYDDFEELLLICTDIDRSGPVLKCKS